jgi:hypothetical protein
LLGNTGYSLGAYDILFGGLLDGVSDELSVKHNAQSERVMNGAFLILRLHPLIVAELPEYNTN